MFDELKLYIQSLPLADEEKERLLKEFKAAQKKMEIAEFKFKRTLADKSAITNILNASIGEIEKQKKIIESARDEINRNLTEMDQQKTLIEEKNEALNSLLSNLTKTQKQLIQSEKMASLGELIAGIAHEIQNPLNFVNNFSELSNEYIEEMNGELASGNYEAAGALAKEVRENLAKITYHGRRADAIVKGMLQHSRTSSGQKIPTDINALADEYLRLAYHGLRAKDKSFNATLKTDYDETIGNISIIPQDIGRVILNLITNALYAVGEKKGQQPDVYTPTVVVGTRKAGNKVEVSVRDNGNGISSKVVDKIFQPFFTTKPTGQGTGLGLSLAYDIIKAQGGELKLETKEGEFTVFTIQLPVE